MKASLHLRLLLAASVVLVAFLGLAGIALDKAFKQSTEQASKERLQAYIYMLLAAANPDNEEGIEVSQSIPEARFVDPGSGLYGFVLTAEGQILWRSDSALAVDIPPLSDLSPGQSKLLITDSELFALYYAVVWERYDGGEQAYLFVVAEEQDVFTSQAAAFRHSLWSWLIGIGCLLIIIQLLILRWSLNPLRDIAAELKAIESGSKTRLDEAYPTELQSLASNLNRLLDSERAHLERYRNTLADLAHSLKTPLSLLRSYHSDQSTDTELKKNLEEQVRRMDNIVKYQLQRAAARGHMQLSASVDIRLVLDKVIASLDKVYVAKKVSCSVDNKGVIKAGLEQGDWFEICGNLLDNAYKWCQHRVDIELAQLEQDGLQQLYIRIEDDGPGIPPEAVEQILQRGMRVDESIDGHGIGLAVVNELVHFYRGKLHPGQGSLGGAQWEIWLPNPI